MRKFTLTIIAALVAVVAFGQNVEKMLKPVQAPRLASLSKLNNQKIPLMNTLSKAPASVDDLEGEYIYLCRSLVSENINFGGTSITIKKVDDKTVSIEHFTSDATNAITATVDFEKGTISIPSGQVLLKSEQYGNVILASTTTGAADLLTPITGTIGEDGSISISSYWGDYMTGMYSKYYWNGIWGYTVIAPANAKMDVTDASTGQVDSYNVFMGQKDKVVTVYNFGNYGQIFDIAIGEDNASVSIESQVGYDLAESDEQGDFMSYALTDNLEEISSAVIEGTISEDAISFKNWAFWDSVSGYVTGVFGDTKIYFTDGETFDLSSTGINAIANQPAVSESYVDLTGRKVSADAKGLVIKTVTYADGTKKSVKVIRK